MSEEGREAWDVLQRCQGQLRFAGMGGVAVGIDLPAAMRLGEDLGYDRRALAVILPRAEEAMVGAVNERLKTAGDGGDLLTGRPGKGEDQGNG